MPSALLSAVCWVPEVTSCPPLGPPGYLWRPAPISAPLARLSMGPVLSPLSTDLCLILNHFSGLVLLAVRPLLHPCLGLPAGCGRRLLGAGGTLSNTARAVLAYSGPGMSYTREACSTPVCALLSRHLSSWWILWLWSPTGCSRKPLCSNSQYFCRMRATKGFAHLHARVHKLCSLFCAVLSHNTILCQCMTKVVRSLHPWQWPPTKLEWGRVQQCTTARPHNIDCLALVWERNVIIWCEMFTNPKLLLPFYSGLKLTGRLHSPLPFCTAPQDGNVCQHSSVLGIEGQYICSRRLGFSQSLAWSCW